MENYFKETFAEDQVIEMQRRFNNIFGQMNVCNLEARQAAILSIINLELLRRKIIQSKNETSPDIEEFLRIQNILNDFFMMLEKQTEERKKHDNTTQMQQRQDKEMPIHRSVSHYM